MKKLLILCLCFASVLGLSACGKKECDHQFVATEKEGMSICVLCAETKQEKAEQHVHMFSEPTCETPAVCSCGKTERSATGHSFSAPSCTTPATCSVCGKTEGAPLGHTLSAATCTTASVCGTCGMTQGSPLGHNFSAATCTTKATCSRCGETTGGTAAHTYSGSVCTVCGKSNGTTQSSSPTYIVSLGKGTPIYRGPGTSFGVVEYLSAAGKFTIVQESYDDFGNRWGLLKSGKGWVYLSSDSPSTPSAPSSSVPYTVALSKGTPIYKGPGTGYTLVEYLSAKGTFTIVQESYDNAGRLWGKLKSGKGWVMSPR